MLLNASADDVGNYRCAANSSAGEEESTTILVRLAPEVADFGGEIAPLLSHTGNSLVVQEGDRVELSCGPRDRLLEVEAHWRRSPTSGSAQMRSVSNTTRREPRPDQPKLSVVYDRQNYTAKLIIESASLNERLYFTCFLNARGLSEPVQSKPVYLRVRSRSLAYWPLAGLLAEALLFAAILYCATTRSVVRLRAEKQPGDCYKCIATLSFNARGGKFASGPAHCEA